MSARPTNTSYAILGLLSFARMSGYDLAAVPQRSIAGFWPIARTQVSAELARLVELGLATGSAAERSGGPAKTIYELTPAGEEALDAWLAEPTHQRTRLRAPALLKLLLGHRSAPREAREQLLTFQATAVQRRDALEGLVARLRGTHDAGTVWGTAPT